LKPILLANVVTLVGTVAFVLCGVFAILAPEFFFNITNSWFHAINLEAIKSTSKTSLGTFVFGVVTFSAYLWLITFIGAYLYKRFTK